MSETIRLKPPIPMETPRGFGYAHFLTDYGMECDRIWTVFQEDGQIWDWVNQLVRVCTNHTIGRSNPEKPERQAYGRVTYTGTVRYEDSVTPKAEP